MKYLVQTNNITEEKNKDLDYGRVISNKEDNSVYLLGYGWKFKWIDLGLPSGTLWMDRNIGATSVEDYGLFYAWGETDGYTYEQMQNGEREFTWETYKWSDDDGNLTKYCLNSIYGKDGFIDNKSELELIDDAAYQYTNGKGKMPNGDDVAELLENTNIYAIKTDGTEVHGTWTDDNELKIGNILWDNELGYGELSYVECRKKDNANVKLVLMPSIGSDEFRSFCVWGSQTADSWIHYNEKRYTKSADALFANYSGMCYADPDYHGSRKQGLPIRAVSV